MSKYSGRLVCPECRNARFSWKFTNIQYGEVYQTVDGKLYEEMSKNGPGVGDDIDENGVFCVTCGEFRDRDELVPEQDQSR